MPLDPGEWRLQTLAVADYGQQGSFAILGTFNAQTNSSPYVGFKTNLHEGGTRVAMIIKVPKAENTVVNNQFFIYQIFITLLLAMRASIQIVRKDFLAVYSNPSKDATRNSA